MSSFALDLKAFGDKAVGKTELIVRKVALDLLRGVVLMTPVLTGRARANWQTTIGTPAIGEVPWVEGSPGGAADKALSDGQVEVAAAQGDVTIFLTNNVPYIVALEEGHSKQAPEGMVRQTIARFPYLVKQEAREVASGA
jgi:hypothetical protein